MGRAPCCDKSKVKRGPWSPEEDSTLRKYVEKHGTAAGSWIALPQKAGLKRCGKSCRLRWLNYLRPNIKHGGFTQQEDSLILSLYHTIGSRWSVIASQLPGRTDNDVKNHWNTKLKKRLPTSCGTSYNPGVGAPTSSFVTSTNTINSEFDDNTSIYLYQTLNNDHQQILVQSPLLPSAPPAPTLSPPFNIHAPDASTNGLSQDDYHAFLLQLDCGFIFDFQDKFNQEFTHFSFGYSPSTLSNAAQEQHTIYHTFT